MGNIDSKEDISHLQAYESSSKLRQGSLPSGQERHRGQRGRQPSYISTHGPKVEVDPFSMLEIEPTLDDTVIKRAYKRLTLKHHPDKGGSKETFDLITKCYVALMKHIEKTSYREADFQNLRQSSKETEQTTQGKRNRHLDQDLRYADMDRITTRHLMVVCIFPVVRWAINHWS